MMIKKRVFSENIEKSNLTLKKNIYPVVRLTWLIVSLWSKNEKSKSTLCDF